MHKSLREIAMAIHIETLHCTMEKKAICVLSGGVSSTLSIISITFYNNLICYINLIFFINEVIGHSSYKLEAHVVYMLTIDNFSTVFPGIHKISVFPKNTDNISNDCDIPEHLVYN